jgi:hypothetical protein
MASSQPFRGIIGLNMIQLFDLGRRPFNRNQNHRRRVTTGTSKLVSAGITSTISAIVGSSGTTRFRSSTTTKITATAGTIIATARDTSV